MIVRKTFNLCFWIWSLNVLILMKTIAPKIQKDGEIENATVQRMKLKLEKW